MKKLLVLFAFVAMTTAVYAQPQLTLGVKFGLNSTKITTDNFFQGAQSYTFSDLNEDTKNGYALGAFARIGWGKMYLQPELLYSLKKGQTTLNPLEAVAGLDPDQAITQQVDVKSIEVPILLGMKLIDFKIGSIRAFTGPAMNVILDGSSISLKQDGLKLPEELYDPKNFKDNSWDWQLGAGVDIATFTFDVRYSWGLSNISDGKASTIGFENKGNMLRLSLGFKFF